MNVIQSTLYCIKTALYIAVTLYITVTGQLPKISSCLNYILCKVDLYIVVTCRVYNGHLNAISEG